MPEDVVLGLPSGDNLTLRRDHGWYEPHPLTSVQAGDVLRLGIELRAGAYRFDFQSEDVYAMSYDDDLGGWMSADSMSYGNRYHLLVRRDAVPEVIPFVQAESSLETKVDKSGSRFLPTGWELVTNVQIDARPKSRPPRGLATLIPAGSGPRLRLLGGLPLTGRHGVYLRGGEPALALSTVAGDGFVSVRKDSTGAVERFQLDAAANRELPLWQLGLEPDIYQICHGESQVTIQVVDGIADTAGPGSGTVRHRGRDGIEVVGTSTVPPSAARLPITVPAPASGDSWVLLGTGPEQHEVVALPEWLSTRTGFELTWANIDAWPQFTPVWIFGRGTSGSYEAMPWELAEPDAGAGARTTQWGRLIGVARLCSWAPEAARALWGRYQRAAGAHR